MRLGQLARRQPTEWHGDTLIVTGEPGAAGGWLKACTLDELVNAVSSRMADQSDHMGNVTDAGVDNFDEKLDEIIAKAVHYETQPDRFNGLSRFQAKQAIKQLIATELGAIIDANIDPDYAVDTDRVYEVLMEWMGELGGSDK